ncbi:hypothetical protein ACFOON_13080 [Novosphingobium piscinae]|uniref:Uncharacterized protein n=2 Tax=Novosphingobium piscinae TaxID=1507448 RepID=A0A7X1FZ81_9SPHN|nr:hypothetical protein [Novosphingobium piscinae]
MLFYVISPILGRAVPNAEHASMLAMGILAVSFAEDRAPLIEDRSVAAAPGHAYAAEKLARRIAAELRHPRPIFTWRALPLVMPCLRILSEDASAQAALDLAKAVHGCIELGLTDAAILGAEAADGLAALPSSRREEAIEGFYDLPPGKQVCALKELAAEDFRRVRPKKQPIRDEEE